MSLYLASAETGADILLTTDIKFLKGCQRIKSEIAVKNPVEFIMEVELKNTANLRCFSSE